MASYRKGKDATFPASKYHSSRRRTPSFSSSSSSFSSSSSLGSMSYFPDDSPASTPATPHRFSGIPFSWELLPGVPKNKLHSHKKNELSRNLLPPPPTAATKTPSSKTGRHSDEAVLRKKHHHLSSPSQSFRLDPFYAAFVECSKDGEGGDRESDAEYWMGPKVGRSSSDRYGLVNLYGSCKNTCAFSDSIVYVPRPRRGDYALISNRSR